MSRTEVQPRAAVIAETDAEPAVDQQARARRKYRVIRLVSILTVLGAWELVGRRIDPLFMSYPSAVAQAAVRLTKSGELPTALVSSLTTLALGFAIAGVLGVLAGLVIGRYRTVEVATDWLVNALYATPLVAVVPLVILWFGLGFSAKLFVVVLLAIFPVLINTASGVRNVPPALIDVGTGFAASEWQVFTKVILPASLPYTMTGLRLGVGRAIIGMVVAEFFTAITGLGALVVKYGNQFDTASMLVPVLVLMVLGVALTGGLRQAEARIAPWKADER
ncbi:ABC transporter permease [Kribbella sp. NPDC050281]|uniref:ABC transporter permease n=1 Tax=Kribbella sp. NPDC050281 TaxID=3155515 RepID=UPI0033DC2DA1